MPSSRDKDWQNIRDIEDALALLARIDMSRKLIRLHAWQQSGSWDIVYDESTAMSQDIEELGERLGAIWAIMHACVTGAE